MYGSRRLTYHQGERSTSVKLHVSDVKKLLVLPSTARSGTPPKATLDCIGALPAATFKTRKKNKEDYVNFDGILDQSSITSNSLKNRFNKET